MDICESNQPHRNRARRERGRLLKIFAIGALAAAAASLPAAAQALKPAPAKANGWVQPRTPDGQPDIQGVWTNGSAVPLERPANLGAKEFYTEAEAAQLLKEGARGDRAALPEAHYDLSQFGLQTGQTKMAANLRTSLIVGPEGRIPPYTPEARKRLAERAAKLKGHEFDSAQTRPLGERCLLWPQEGPPMLPMGYNSNLEIVQSPGWVAILSEMIHDTRMIPLDGRPHLPPEIRQWRGDSRGHWEGNTLVVDTTNFTDKTAFRGSTENLHVIERFTRTAEDTLLYEFTVEDPATWTKPWTAQMPMLKIEGPIFEYACHEGNYGLANNLSGARAAEKAEAERSGVGGKAAAQGNPGDPGKMKR
jgi:hypothetical protein